MNGAERWILLAVYVARMEDTRLPKGTIFGVRFLRVAEKGVDGASPGLLFAIQTDQCMTNGT